MDALSHYRKTKTSQHGEEGVLEKIFEIIGTKNAWCVEFGAGASNNNTWTLVNEKNWNGVLIESHPIYFKELNNFYKEKENVTCLEKAVSFEGTNTLDKLLAVTSIPHDFDLLIVDIDGNDYHVWEAVREYMPRVVVIEYNKSIPLGVEFTQPKGRQNWGSSLTSLNKLAKKKGYELVYAHVCNAIFVKRELFSHFNIQDNSPQVLATGLWNEARFFQGYDGTIFLEGIERKEFLAHKKKIFDKSVYIQTKGKLFPLEFKKESFLIGGIKKLVQKTPLYGILYPFVAKINRKKWKRKRKRL